MPGSYEGMGVAFLYPDSWVLESDEEAGSVSVESPEGAFLSVTRCAGMEEAFDALERAVSAMGEEYDEVEREGVGKTIAGVELTGSILRFVFLDLIVTSQLLVLDHAGEAYLVQIQAEDRDHDRLQVVFEAVLTSLCQHLNRPG